MAPKVMTIGHSNLPFERFVTMLLNTGVTAVADVRSSPWSRFNPQYNRSELKRALQECGIAYRFYGRLLGGRPDEPSLFSGGIADYEAMAQTSGFAEGLDLVLAGTKKHLLALMCSEQDPLDCHRCLLVGRALVERSILVEHILSNGEIKPHSSIEESLLEMSGRASEDFFAPRFERLNAAYRDRSLKVAYAESGSTSLDEQELENVRFD